MNVSSAIGDTCAPLSNHLSTSPVNANVGIQDSRLGLLRSPGRSALALKDRMAAAAAMETARQTPLKQRMAATLLGGAVQVESGEDQQQESGRDQLGACMAALEAEMNVNAVSVAGPSDTRLSLLRKKGPSSPQHANLTLKQRMVEAAAATPTPPVDAADERVYE